MCGIVGMFAMNGSTLEGAPHLIRMRDALAHRGPDGAGAWRSPDDRVALGHRRLSILDLTDAAAQPMTNEDGLLRISFNGEIYNHAEIRAELERTGRHRWQTDHSDTEVILHAYEEWGVDCLHRLRGMFAFALSDGRQRRLWLVRDRLGIKPLYYSVRRGRLTFASEIKALLLDPDQPRRLHEEALYHYLSFLTTPAPQTLFDGIRKLPAGSWLCAYEDGTVEEQRWWDAWDQVTPLTACSEQEIAE
ncbi:MAG: asparagine synthetase B family protein, partial [Terriglobia bacterium]